MSSNRMRSVVQRPKVMKELPDVPVISRNELLQKGAIFYSKQGVDTFTSLLFDMAELRHDTLVGARNHMFRFNESFDLQEVIELAPTADQTQNCSMDHKKEDCHNFIQVLVHSESVGVNMIFACGTNAYAPVCSVRHAGQINIELESINGQNWFPSKPHVPGAAYFGERLFLATALDELGNKSCISSTDLLNPSSDAHVRTPDNIAWLYNAEFVEAFQFDKFVFFVFREVGIETPDGKIYSRIGRVCEDDKGKNGRWTSFTKARLQCADFNKVQGATFSLVARILYASFISDAGTSAVCAFDYSAIEVAFEGPYKCRMDGNLTWVPCPNPETPELPDETCFGLRSLPSINNRILMWESILPKCGNPLYKDHKRQFSVIDVAEEVPGGPFAFVGDQDGTVLKLGSLECSKTRPLEIWEVTQPNDPKKNKSINVLSVHQSVFLLTNDGILKVPLEDFGPTPTTKKFSTGTPNSRGPKTKTTTTSRGAQIPKAFFLLTLWSIVIKAVGTLV